MQDQTLYPRSFGLPDPLEHIHILLQPLSRMMGFQSESCSKEWLRRGFAEWEVHIVLPYGVPG